MTTTINPARPIHEIAREIKKAWGNKVYFGAVPYLEAMLSLNTLKENYGCDSADSIIRYFLANASSFRGEVARAAKKELNAMLKEG